MNQFFSGLIKPLNIFQEYSTVKLVHYFTPYKNLWYCIISMKNYSTGDWYRKGKTQLIPDNTGVKARISRPFVLISTYSCRRKRWI